MFSNRDCVYSWGYQIWKNGNVVFEGLYSLAGKRNPLGGGAVTNELLNTGNTGMPVSAERNITF